MYVCIFPRGEGGTAAGQVGQVASEGPGAQEDDAKDDKEADLPSELKPRRLHFNNLQRKHEEDAMDDAAMPSIPAQAMTPARQQGKGHKGHTNKRSDPQRVSEEATKAAEEEALEEDEMMDVVA